MSARSIVFVTLLGALTWLPIHASQDSLLILYTSNLSAALDDCECGGDTVGGMTRLVSAIDTERASMANSLLLDAGDLFSSYSMPAANRAMLKLSALVGYDAINIGDQEFVEGLSFLTSQLADTRSSEMFLSSITSNENHVSENGPVRIFRKNGWAVLVLAATEPAAFEFVSAKGLASVSPAKTISSNMDRMTQSDCQILLFHGPWNRARQLARLYSSLDIIIIGHNQLRQSEYIGGTLLVETGSDAEFLGKILLVRTGEKIQTENTFLPILKDTHVHSEAVNIVERALAQ